MGRAACHQFPRSVGPGAVQADPVPGIVAQHGSDNVLTCWRRHVADRSMSTELGRAAAAHDRQPVEGVAAFSTA